VLVAARPPHQGRIAHYSTGAGTVQVTAGCATVDVAVLLGCSNSNAPSVHYVVHIVGT
jgi:hypothetical protein